MKSKNRFLDSNDNVGGGCHASPPEPDHDEDVSLMRTILAPSVGESWSEEIAEVFLTILLTCLALCFYNYRVRRIGTKKEDARNRRAELREIRRRNVDSAAALACATISRRGDKVSGKLLCSVFEQLWKHASVAASAAIKDALEPTLATLKVPMRFVKLDLGDVPVRVENIFVHNLEDSTEALEQHLEYLESMNGNKGNKNSSFVLPKEGGKSGMQIDLDVVWDGNCDVMLQAAIGIAKSSTHVAFGVRRIKLSGRMSVLLGPLTCELPVISAIQFGFTNPPKIQLDFAGLAESIAKQFAFVQPTVLSCVQNSLASMLVLPQRMTMPIDLLSFDYLDTYQPPVGIIRITAVRARGLPLLRRMLINDIPDTYAVITLGGYSPPFRTSTVWDDYTPTWNESCDFVLYDLDQIIYVELYDDDPSPIDAIKQVLGRAEISVRDLFTKGQGEMELELALKDKSRSGRMITISANIFDLNCHRLGSLLSPEFHGENKICGLVTIIVSRARGVPLDEEEAATYVKVVSRNETFYTPTITETVDVLNPIYASAFHLPLTVDSMLQKKGSFSEMVTETEMPRDAVPPPPSTKKDNISPSTRKNRTKLAASIVNKYDDLVDKAVPAASSMLNKSVVLVEQAVHWQGPARRAKGKMNTDIVFTLMNDNNSTTNPQVDRWISGKSNTHSQLGSFTVTHESLMRARNHTITERRPFGNGASLEYRVILSGVQSDDNNDGETQDSMDGSNRSYDPLTQTSQEKVFETQSVRVTALKGRGFHIRKRTLQRNIFPDVYLCISLNSTDDPQKLLESWRTSTIQDDTMPHWNECQGFVITDTSTDFIKVDAYHERNKRNDEYLGSAEYPMETLLRKRQVEMELLSGNESTGSYVTLKCVKVAKDTDDSVDNDASFNFGNGSMASLQLSGLSERRMTAPPNYGQGPNLGQGGDDWSTSENSEDFYVSCPTVHNPNQHKKSLMRKLTIPMDAARVSIMRKKKKK